MEHYESGNHSSSDSAAAELTRESPAGLNRQRVRLLPLACSSSYICYCKEGSFAKEESSEWKLFSILSICHYSTLKANRDPVVKELYSG